MKFNKEKIKKQLSIRKDLMEMRHSPDNSGYPLTRRQVEKMLSQYERREDEDGWNDSPEYRSVDGWKKARWYPPEVDSDFEPDITYFTNPDQRPAKLMPYDYFFNVYKLDDVNKQNHADIDDDDDKKNFVKDYNWKGETNVFESLFEDTMTSKTFEGDDYTNDKNHTKYIKLRDELTPVDLDKKSEGDIEGYTHFSKNINRNLYDKENGSDYTKSYINQADAINDALDKFPKSKTNFVVYHGVKSNFDHDNLKSGNDFRNAGFLSTSLSPIVAKKFVDYDAKGRGNLLRIHVSANQQVGGYIEKFSGQPNEREFLIKHHRNIKIMNKAETIKLDGKTIQVWDAVIK